MAYSEEERAAIIAKVIAGLRAGTPLTVLCAEDGMPCDDTIRDWAEADKQLSRDIARAREVGFDSIALDALAIADDTANDTRVTGHDEGEREVANTEWITRSKLRVETRLKLLAKWDPKRYGDAMLHKHADADGEKLAIDSTSIAVRAAALIRMGLDQADAGDV